MFPIFDLPSPNFNERRLPVDMIVLHYTGMRTFDEALRRLTDPSAQVGAHYAVSKSGDARGRFVLAGNNGHEQPVDRHRNRKRGTRIRLRPFSRNADGIRR